LVNNKILENQDQYIIYPANIFVTDKEDVKRSIFQIQDDLVKQIEFFNEIGKNLESKRIQNRVELDLEMIRELGYCSGIENYSRYFDNRKPGDRPFCLLDYFPEDFLMVIDESHVTISQIKAMYGGDRSRKVNLVDYGFRLPAALDNRPLKFEEFEQIHNQIIYVSATPAEYELTKCDGIVTEQLIRPTGLLDPEITVKPKLNQVDDLLEEIRKVVEDENRVLVTTLTKRMAEELDKYFAKIGIRSRYIHSDVDTLERVEILQDLRKGIFDVLIGVNLLREGLDLPEVSLVAILDADNEGFLRSERSLVQTVGRAARNINGRVIMYADKITKAMDLTINETNRRRDNHDLVQVFDSWAGILSPEYYEEFGFKYLEIICNSIKEVPKTIFSKGAFFALEKMNNLNCETIGLDWTMSIKNATQIFNNKTLQGNLDPCVLYGDYNTIEKKTKEMLHKFENYRHIANLGHGVYPDTDPEKVKCFIESVKSYK